MKTKIEQEKIDKVLADAELINFLRSIAVDAVVTPEETDIYIASAPPEKQGEE